VVLTARLVPLAGNKKLTDLAHEIPVTRLFDGNEPSVF